MGLLPATLAGKVQFYKARLAAWAAHSVAIGSSGAEIAALTTLVNDADAALTDQTTKKADAESATNTLHNKVDGMQAAGALVIKKIRTAAVADPTVYDLAMIPPPATPSPAPAPGLPYKFVATLSQDGSLMLTWKCNNPSGVAAPVYQVLRSEDDGATWMFIGATGPKELVDDKLPTGLAKVTYQVYGIRSTVAGPVAEFTVKFGKGSGGATVASVVQTTPKMAA